MITCPNCGTEIPLSEALAEQFRHENEARLKVLAGQAEQQARADFARRKAIPRRPARRGAAQVPGGAAGRARTAQGKGAHSKPAPASSTSKWRAASTSEKQRLGRTAGSKAQGEGQADRGSAQGARRREAQERAGLAGAAGRSAGDRCRGRARAPLSAGCDRAGGEGRARRRPRARGARPRHAGLRHDRLGDQEHPALAARLARQGEGRTSARSAPTSPSSSRRHSRTASSNSAASTASGSPACAPGRRWPWPCASS